MGEGPQPVCTKRACRRFHFFRNGGQRRCEHQHGEWQHILNEAEQNRRIIIEQPHGRDADKAKRLVDHALITENDEPAIGAHDLTDEEGQEQRDQQEFAQCSRWRAHHEIGIGNARRSVNAVTTSEPNRLRHATVAKRLSVSARL